MHRRDFLRGATTAAAVVAAGRGLRAGASPSRTAMGLCVYCLGHRVRADRGRPDGLGDPLRFLEHARSLGAGGMQFPIRARDEAYASRLRSRAEELGVFVEGIHKLPRDASDVERFEAEVRTARLAGARVSRVVLIPGGRVAKYPTADDFRAAEARGRASLELAERVAARHRLTLAVENHRDQRVEERLEVLRGISSEWVGACLDLGNSFALLEEPVEYTTAYAPWARSVHIKDHAVRPTPEGFRIADVALGKGFLPLERLLGIVRAARPDVRVSLEVISRDPSDVACLTEAFWATFRDVPARDLARTLAAVRKHAAAELPRPEALPPAETLAYEARAVTESIAWAAAGRI